MIPWWSGLPPAQTTLPCGEETHRIRWEAGALHALDHDDPEAELALVALGGERCPCVDVLDAWARHDTDTRVLVLASRGPSDPLAARADWTAGLGSVQGYGGFLTPTATTRTRTGTRALFSLPLRRRATPALGANATAPVPHRPPPVPGLSLRTQGESELVALLGLGGGLQDRLVATVAAKWAKQFEQPDEALREALPGLHASMQGRLVAALGSWLGRSDLEVEFVLIEGRRTPALSESGGIVRAELPLDWLADVWSRGLSTVWGRFCLAAASENGRAWTLSTVGPDLGPPAPIRVELPASE